MKKNNDNLDNAENMKNTENTENTNETAKDNSDDKNNKNEDLEETKNNEACDKEDANSEKDKILELEDKYKRLLAEFDNFRKRSEKESMQMCDIGASLVIGKVLPVLDNFERALQNVPEDLKTNPFVEGIDKTYKQFLKILEELDVKPIEALGKKFDVKLHNAVLSDDESDAEVDSITEELQKGYMYKETVVRPSMVKVKK